MALGTKMGLSPGDLALDGDPTPLPKKGAPPPIFSPCLLWPYGWTDQDATWYGGRPQPRRHCVRWGPSLLWPNGWMDQDGTWHGCLPRSRPYCARWGPSYPPQKEGGAPQFSAHVYCGQTAGRIKMPVGTDVGLSLGDIVLDGDPSPLARKGNSSPIFGQCPLWLNGWMDQDATWYECKHRPRRRCARWGRISP